MTRTNRFASFRASFEMLEKRELMAADMTSVSAFFASASLGTRVTGTQAAPATPATSEAPPAPAASVGAPVVDWFSVNLYDAALRDLARAGASDGTLNRTDMLSLFSQVQKDGTISSNELNDLKKIVANNSLFGTNEYVHVISTDVVVGNKANATFHGQFVGNLYAGAPAGKLELLAAKWFLGLDHPTAMAGTTYRQAAGSLFPHAPSYTDVVQGSVGDCYFLASLGETALRSPGFITNMFTVNGDGTYGVRFYNNGRSDYVTVDSMLPVNSRGMYVYANMGQSISTKTNVLWVALAEKAYVQMNEAGWMRAKFGDPGTNSYDAISGGYMTDALNQITYVPTAYAAVDQNLFVTNYNRGCLITFGSYSNPKDGVVGNHAYAVVGYDATRQTVTLFNPWGVNNRSAPGLVTLTFAQLKSDFFGMEYTI